MLNVCFDESECGMLKFALRGESVTFSHRALEIGLIHPNHFEEGRRAWIGTFFSICSKEEQAKIWQEDCARFQTILDTTRKEKQLRIWYASSARAKCGFYHLIHALQDIECSVYIVEMPSDIGFRDPSFDKSWGGASPDEAYECLALQRKLTLEERNRFSQLWEILEAENAELRLNVNNRLTSLPIEYLDNEILCRAPKDKEFKFGWLVGEMIISSTHALCSCFVSTRIETLTNSGKLVWVNKAQTHGSYYNSILRAPSIENKQG